jgi:hypothetical protein
MRPFAPLPHWLHGRSYVSHELRAYATPWARFLPPLARASTRRLRKSFREGGQRSGHEGAGLPFATAAAVVIDGA